VTACLTGRDVHSSVVTVVRESAYLPSYTLPSPLQSFSSRYNLPLRLRLSSSFSFLPKRNVVRRCNILDGECSPCREKREESCSHTRHSSFFNTSVLRLTDIRQPSSTCQYIVLLSLLRCDDLQYVRWTCYDVRSVSRTTFPGSRMPCRLLGLVFVVFVISTKRYSRVLHLVKYDVIQV
jgi:hypothetical protein